VIRQRADEHHRDVHRAEKQVRVGQARRPFVHAKAQVEVRNQGHDEHRTLDHHEPDSAPPDETLVTEGAFVGQARHVDRAMSRESRLSHHARASCT
jgi:hypothetical protein